MHTPYSLGDRDEVRSQFTEAGFTPVSVTVVSRPVRFTSPVRFVELGVLGAAAAVPAMQAMGEDERARLIDAIHADMEAPLRAHTEDGVLVFPTEAHVVVAEKPR
jgi:hypothetical protein